MHDWVLPIAAVAAMLFLAARHIRLRFRLDLDRRDDGNGKKLSFEADFERRTSPTQEVGIISLLHKLIDFFCGR